MDMKRGIFLLVTTLLILCLGYACAADETVFEYGHLRVHLPLGIEAVSYQDGVYYDGDLRIQCVGGKIQEDFAAVADSIDAKTLFEYWFDDDSIFVNVQAYTNDYGVKYACFDSVEDVLGLPCKGIALYGKGEFVMALVSSDSNSNTVSDKLLFIGKNAELRDETNAIIESSVVKQEDGFTLLKGPITLSITEEDWNVFYAGMPEDALTLQRVGISESDASLLVDKAFAEIMIQPTDERFKDRTLYVKLKDNKYADYSTDMCDLLLVTTAEQLSTSGYTIEKINGITYYAFQAFENQYRYATIVNGDMLYYILVCDGTIDEADKNLLHTFVESVSYTD